MAGSSHEHASVLGLLLLLFCFSRCKETVVIEARKKVAKIPVGKSLKCLALNKYFWMAMTIWMMFRTSSSIRGHGLAVLLQKYIFMDSSSIPSCIFWRWD